MKKPSKPDRTQTELSAALHALRLVVREVGGNYLAGLQAKVARVEQAARLGREGGRSNRKQLGQMRQMLKWITNLEVEPQKGRRRDLRDLDKLIAKLGDLADNW